MLKFIATHCWIVSHNCFISFKKEDTHYCEMIAEKLKTDKISRRYLDEWIDSDDLDYVIQKIRSNYMDGTSVTLYLIGLHSSENEGFDERGRSKQNFVIRELQATLLDKENNRMSGLIGIVLPDMVSKIYSGSYRCKQCGKEISNVCVNDDTVLKEFSENYWLKASKCGHYPDDGRYCILVKYDDFMSDPDKFIDQAFEKTKSEIAKDVHFRDIKHEGMKLFR